MTLRATMQSALRVACESFGETWQYRRMTSGPAVATRTYGSWTDVAVNARGVIAEQAPDEDGGGTRRRERDQVAISDALAVLHAGDQLKDAAGVAWAVIGIASTALGVVVYDIERDLPLRRGSDRKAGV